MHPSNTLYDQTDSGINWKVAIPVFVLIIGVSALFILPDFMRSKAGGIFNQCQGNLKKIGAALEMYADDNDGCYPPKMEMLSPDYLPVIPTCATQEVKLEIISGKRTSYFDTYKVSDDFSIYTFYCGSRAHHGVGIPDNYPQYNSINGLIPK